MPAYYESLNKLSVSIVGIYISIKCKIVSIFSRLSIYGNIPFIAADGVIIAENAARLVIVFYSLIATKWNTFSPQT